MRDFPRTNEVASFTARRRALRRVALMLATVGPLSRAYAGESPQAQRVALPTPWMQLHAGPDDSWLGIDAGGALWRVEGSSPRKLGDGFDPQTPLAGGFGRIAARRADGRLGVMGSSGALGMSTVRVNRFAGLLVLPLAVLGISDETVSHVLRFEPAAGDARWDVTDRGTDAVVPDARPIQVDLDGRGDGGHVVVLGGPDRVRYKHGVLGDDIEATRVLWLERHALTVMRAWDVAAPDVIEDIAPRVWSSGGRTGLLTIRSGADGARLVLLEADPTRANAIRVAASGDALGAPHRWMAPSTSDGEIVAVHTPHVGGILHGYRRVGDRLIATRWSDGVSTHAIGTRELDVSAWVGSRFVVPDQERRRLVVFDRSSGARVDTVAMPARVTSIAAAPDRSTFACLLEDGSVWRVATARG